MSAPGTGATAFLMMGLEQRIEGAKVGAPLTDTAANWGLKEVPIDPAAIYAQAPTWETPAELTGTFGQPEALRGRTTYPLDWPQALRTAPLVPTLASFLREPTVTRDGTSNAWQYVYTPSDSEDTSVSLWGIYHPGGDHTPLIWRGAKFNDFTLTSSGTGIIMCSPKGQGCGDTEHGIGVADAGNTGGYVGAPVLSGDRSDAARLTDELTLEVTDAPAAGEWKVSVKLGSGSASTAKTTIPYDTSSYLGTAWAELVNDSGAVGFDECENRQPLLVFFPRRHAGTVAAPSSGPTAALISPAAAGNVDNGDHLYKVTFVNATGETTGSAASLTVTVADKAVNGKVVLTAIPTGEYGITSRKIYRTEAGLTTYKLLTTLSNNTATTYTDNIADSGLGATMPVSNTATRGPAVGDKWVFPALCQIPGTGSGETGVARTKLTGCRFGPAHVTLKAGALTASTTYDWESGSVKLSRQIQPAYTHGPNARNPFDMDITGYLTCEVEIDRRYITREFERLIRTNDRLVMEILFQGAPISGSASAWAEMVKLEFPQVRVDSSASPLTGPGVTKEKVKFIVEQDSAGSAAMTATVRSATQWDFSDI